MDIYDIQRHSLENMDKKVASKTKAVPKPRKPKKSESSFEAGEDRIAEPQKKRKRLEKLDKANEKAVVDFVER